MISKKFIGVFFLVSIFFFNTTSNAQQSILQEQKSPIDQGNKLIAGGLSFSSSGGDLYESNNERLNSIKIAPTINFFVFKGFALGGKLQLDRQSQGSSSNTVWGIGPQFMWFPLIEQPTSEIKGFIYPYIGAYALFAKDTLRYEVNKDSVVEKAEATFYGFGGGFCCMLTETVGLMAEGIYELQVARPENIESIDGNSFTFNISIAAFLE